MYVYVYIYLDKIDSVYTPTQRNTHLCCLTARHIWASGSMRLSLVN